MLEHYRLPPKSFRFLIVILLILGIFFRFANLEQKLFWGDECITSVRVAGYQGELVYESVPSDEIITPEAMKKFQRVNQETSLLDTIKVTAHGAPQHTPLYFVLTRIWVQLLGDSVAAMRSFTALTSLLALPAVYWLCIELFKSSTVAWTAVALMSVSPVHIIHAQNARPQSLWILMILLSSAALLQALRLNKKLNWVIYGVTLALSFYTFLFSVFILIAHGIYVISREKFRITLTLKTYLLTLVFSALSFLPWAFVIITNIETATGLTDWLKQPAPYLDLFMSWTKNFCDIFLYWHDIYETKLFISEESFVIYLGTAILSLVIYSFYFLYKQTPREVWLFIFTLTGVTALALVLPDILFGGRRSALARYIFPCILGIQVTVAYLLATKFSAISSNNLRVKSWRLATALLISFGVLFGTINSQTETWNGKEDFILQSARIINQSQRPVVISEGEIVFGLMPLNYRLDPHVRWLLLSQSTGATIPDGFSDVFLFSTSQELRSQLEKQQKVRLKPAYQNSYLGNFAWKASSPDTLWKLER